MTEKTSSTRGFVHLHVHSEYSPIDSLAKVKDLVAMAAADGNPAIAVTDHGTLGGLWKLGQHATAKGIKPIPGLEAYLAFGSRFEQNAIDVDHDDDDPNPEGTRGGKKKRYMHLTVLATTRTGWHNLVQMVNASHDPDAFWSKPRIDYELLKQHSEGLIVLTGCLGGPVAGPLSRGDKDGARQGLRSLIDAVGKDNVYVEVMDHDIEAQHVIMGDLRALAAEFDLPLVATNDAHYIHEDQSDAHEAWLAVGTRAKLADDKRFRFHGGGHHLRTEAEMRVLQGGADWWQAACDTTVAIADRVADDVLPEPKMRLPKYPVPDGFDDAATYLRHLVRQGAFDRYGPDPARSAELGKPVLAKEVNDRLKFEFGVINGAGLADYFLITWDAIEWARSDRGLPTPEHPDGEPGQKLPIRVGPGRGSAAGAAVSYCLRIVGVDPLANNLLFERFLNPERTGMPDIDVDFEQGRRGEVLRYLERRYGRDRVARIGTFGIAATRAAIKDAARVLGVTFLGDRLSPLVPIGGSGKPVPFSALDDTTDKSTEEFRKAVAAHPAGHDLLELARAFEGVTKQEGIHACGTLVADEPMAPLVPLRRDRSKGATDDDLLVTVWDGKDVDAYGLLKMDVLGLRNLDVVSAAVRFIERDTGESIDPDLLQPGNPEDRERDTKAWELIASGRTAGVFQLESAGMTKLAEQVAPNSLADLTALVALFRPGPLAAGMHEHYAARKHGREAVDYGYLTTDPAETDAIASVLGETYGTIVYQEQIMRLGEVVGGLEPGVRNKLQKAFSKKNAEMMAEVKEVFFAGALAGRGTSGVRFAKATLDRLWVTFEGAAAYLFNASHACAYGYLAYQTAYLKANWPVQYGAALLSVTDDDDKRRSVIRSLQTEGIAILAPDVNTSAVHTAPEGAAVRLGLSEVKGVGKNATRIITERDQHGPYTSLADLLGRVKVPGQTKAGAPTVGALAVNTVEALIEAGAMDGLGPRLGQVMIARAVKAAPDLPVPDAEWGVLERSARQRRRLGLTAGDHPLALMQDQVKSYRPPFKKTALPVGKVAGTHHGERVHVVGVLSGWVQKAYRRGQMVTLTIEGSTGSVEGVMWDEDRAKLPQIPTVGQVVAVDGQVQVRVVETERVDEAGETVSDTFERRDLTVRAVTVLPLDDPSRLALPDAPRLIATLEPATPGDEVEAAQPTLELVEPTSPPDAPERAPDTVDAPAGPARPSAVATASFVTGVAEDRVRAAMARHGMPDGYFTPTGGVWVLVDEHGPLVVSVGGHPIPAGIEHTSAEPGWFGPLHTDPDEVVAAA